MAFEKGYMLWLAKQPVGKLPAKLIKIKVRNVHQAVIDYEVPALMLRPKAGCGQILILCLTGALRDDAADEFALAVLAKGTSFRGKNYLEADDCVSVTAGEIPPEMLGTFRVKFKSFSGKLHLCPNCRGKGSVSGDPAFGSSAECHVCEGEGQIDGRALPC